MSYVTMRRLIGAAALAAVVFGAAPARAAASFSDIYFFGDSLSDTGNLSISSGGLYPGAGYYGGGFSDGPLWTQKMATVLGKPSAADPYLNYALSLTPGNNYAFAGARTGTGSSPPGVLAQVGGIWGPSHATADPNALYVVVGGGNDMRDARSAPGSSDASRQAAAEAARDNLNASLGILASKGAKHVLVANLPDLGTTPEAIVLGVTAASTDATNRFNALMPSVVSYGSSLGMHMTFLDLAGISSLIRLDATNNGGGIFGITNITLPCMGGGPACSISAFSDGLHPSSRVHEIVGVFAANGALTTLAAVPEPETYALMLAGLALVAGVARRRRALAV